MQIPTTTKNGNVKLRGLLNTSQELLRKRQLKKALNNAQIAQDFASRSGEAPAIAFAAQLLIAEIYLLNAVYTSDESLRHKGWNILEQLDTADKTELVSDSILEVRVLKAVCLNRLGEFKAAKDLLECLLPQLAESHPSFPKATVALVTAYTQSETTIPAQVLAKAEVAVHRVDSIEKISLIAELALSKAQTAEKNKALIQAIDEAHTAKSLASEAENPELVANAELLLGRLSRLRGNNQIALRLLYEAMDTAERLEYRSLLCEVHLEIGHIFEMLNNDREANKYFNFVDEEASLLRCFKSIYAANIALGRSSHRYGELEAAGAHFSKALTAANQTSSIFEQGVVLGEMAYLKFDDGEFNLAKHLAEESVKRFSTIENDSAFAKTYFVLAKLHYETNPEEVESILEEIRIASKASKLEKNFELLVKTLRFEAELNTQIENFEEAYFLEKEASSLALIMLRQQRERQLPDLDMRAALRQKELEIEKLTQQNELKNAIVAKNEEIERANHDLIQANEELRQFAYVASHDLKEPLRQIGSFVSLIKRNYLAELDEKGETFFGYVTEGVTRLNRLLDSLMHYTSVGRIDKEVATVDLNRMVASLEQELATTIKECGASIIYKDLPSIETGGKLLRHVLFSLFDNALKFSREGASPEIIITAEKDDSLYCLRIQDNGIGIKPEYQDKVFTLFQMLHAKSTYPGTGVGLAIAQKTIQRLGGRIWFETNGSQLPGTSFYITLPVKADRDITSINSPEKAA